LQCGHSFGPLPVQCTLALQQKEIVCFVDVTNVIWPNIQHRHLIIDVLRPSGDNVIYRLGALQLVSDCSITYIPLWEDTPNLAMKDGAVDLLQCVVKRAQLCNTHRNVDFHTSVVCRLIAQVIKPIAKVVFDTLHNDCRSSSAIKPFSNDIVSSPLDTKLADCKRLFAPAMDHQYVDSEFSCYWLSPFQLCAIDNNDLLNKGESVACCCYFIAFVVYRRG
jgi:hypothetical protein